MLPGLARSLLLVKDKISAILISLGFGVSKSVGSGVLIALFVAGIAFIKSGVVVLFAALDVIGVMDVFAAVKAFVAIDTFTTEADIAFEVFEILPVHNKDIVSIPAATG